MTNNDRPETERGRESPGERAEALGDDEPRPHLEIDPSGAVRAAGARTGGLEIADALSAIENVTEQVLHEVRNLMLPLTVQLDMAAASVDPGSAAHAALLEMMTSCRRCGVTLDRIEKVTDPAWNPDGELHARDLFERIRLILRHVLRDRVRVQIDAPESIPMLKGRLRDLQGALLEIVGRETRPAFRRVLLRAVPQGRRVRLDAVFTCADGVDIESLATEPPLTTARGECIIDGKIEAEGGRITIKLLVDTVATPKESPDGKAGGSPAGRVLLLHDDALRRELIRSFLTERGYSVSCGDPAAGERLHDVVVVDRSCTKRVPAGAPRVVLGAESRSSAAGVLPLPTPYHLEDVVAAIAESMKPIDDVGTES